VFERDPATFAGALVLAQTKTATDVTFKTASRASIHAFANLSSAMADNGVNYLGVYYSGKGRGGGKAGLGKGGSSHAERREREAGKCWICNSSSHQKSACPVWDKALTLARKESPTQANLQRPTRSAWDTRSRHCQECHWTESSRRTKDFYTPTFLCMCYSFQVPHIRPRRSKYAVQS
jgi:hypothetical protein